MKRSNKKGFTIVELVIVIAVIAILAAVLIPTIAGLVRKANVASDTAVAKNMNSALAEYSAKNGTPDSFDEVLEAIEAYGYVLANLNAKADGNLYGWDSKNNQIVYIDVEGEEIYSNTAFDKADVKFVVNGNTTVPSGFSAEVVDMTKPEGPKALKAAIEDGMSVTLKADMTITEAITIPEKANITLDIGGKKLTTEALNAGTESQISKYINVSKDATLTFVNGTFEGRGIMNNGGNITIKDGAIIKAVDVNGGGCIRNNAGSTLTIDGGTFEVPNYNDINNGGGVAAVYNKGGTVTINGGTFTSKTAAYLVSNVENGTLTINGGTFTAFRGNIFTNDSTTVINGGTFSVTNGEAGGWIVCHMNGGSTTLEGGEFTTVTSNKFYNVTDNTNK